MLPIKFRVADGDIRSISVHVPLPFLLRLDVFPFGIIYLTIFCLYYAYPASHAIMTIMLSLTIFLHGLAFLLTEWSIDVKAWMHFTPLKSISITKTSLTESLHVKVSPKCSHSPKAICRLDFPIIHFKKQAAHESAHMEEDQLNALNIPSVSFSYQQIQFAITDFAINSMLCDIKHKPSDSDILTFTRTRYPTHSSLSSYIDSEGNTDKVSYAAAQARYGENEFTIPDPSFQELLRDQLIAPFFVFQFVCMLLWCLDDNVYYSLMTLFVLIIFECTVVKQQQINMESMQQMRDMAQRCLVYRFRKWIEIWSRELVPGDICSVGRTFGHFDKEEIMVPCDVLLLTGNCIVNESMLTGESIPLRKEAIKLEYLGTNSQERLQIEDKSGRLHQKHVVYGGTKVLQNTSMCNRRVIGSFDCGKVVPSPSDNGCIAFVLRTGFGSTKGALIRTILNTSQRMTANNAEVMWFIICLLVVAITAASYVLLNGLRDPTRNKYKLFLHCIMIITSVVPPELPMELSLAVTNSLISLVKVGIYCTEPFRIPFGGRIDYFCFDKTGTLTSDDFTMLGVAGLPEKDQDCSGIFHLRELALVSAGDLALDIALVLVGCQSLLVMNAAVIGDPLETTIYNSLQWRIQSHPASSFETTMHPLPGSAQYGILDKLTILHRYSFSSELKRMSTVVALQYPSQKRNASNLKEQELRVLCKGAPEILEPLFSSKPACYRRVYEHYASRDCRILALYYQFLEKTTWWDNSIRRDDIEKNLVFAGFVLLDCPLKQGTEQTVRALLESNHRVVMITGDNAATACDIARQVGILQSPDTKPTLLLKASREKYLEWVILRDSYMDPDTATPSPIPFEEKSIAELAIEYELCASGEAISSLLNARISDKAKESNGWDTDAAISMRRLSSHCAVFARMSPFHKEQVIRALNDCGYITAMCGDGTNDVGALKQAHVGISIVSAPKVEQMARACAKQESIKEKRLSDNAVAQNHWSKFDIEEEETQIPSLGDASIASPFSIHLQVLKYSRGTRACSAWTLYASDDNTNVQNTRD